MTVGKGSMASVFRVGQTVRLSRDILFTGFNKGELVEIVEEHKRSYRVKKGDVRFFVWKDEVTYCMDGSSEDALAKTEEEG